MIIPDQISSKGLNLTSHAGSLFTGDVSLTALLERLHRSGNRVIIPASSHGFSVKQVLRINSSGDLVTANSSSFDTVGNIFIPEVINSNTYTVQLTGYVSGLSGGVAGETWWLQDNGTLGSTPGTIPQKILQWISSSTAFLFGESVQNPIRLSKQLVDDATFSLGSTPCEIEVYDSSSPTTTFAKVIFSGSAVNLWFGSTNTIDSDSDTYLCIYHSGGNLIIKNRLGSTKTFSIYKKVI